MEGKRPRGRPRIGMIDELIEGSYVSMKMRAAARTCLKAETGASSALSADSETDDKLIIIIIINDDDDDIVQ